MGAKGSVAMARGNSLCALSGVQFMASGRDQSRPYISNGGQLLAFTDVAHTSRPPWQVTATSGRTWPAWTGGIAGPYYRGL